MRRRYVVLRTAALLFAAAAVVSSSFVALLLSSSLQQQQQLQDDRGDRPASSPSMTFSSGRHHRRLQSSSSSFNCPEIMKNRPTPQLPVIPLLKQSFYAASFPGTNDKLLSKSLVESMTGLLVGDASTSPSLKKMEALGDSNVYGQGEVIALRTHFPHTSGKLASYDEDISKAFIILRNPLYAIPQYFNQVYRNNNHLMMHGLNGVTINYIHKYYYIDASFHSGWKSS